MSYEHRECENALDRIESALSDAQTALAALPDAEGVEAEVGQLADDARDCHNQAESLLTTDLEDVEDELRQLIAQLSELCTDASSLYNRL